MRLLATTWQQLFSKRHPSPSITVIISVNWNGSFEDIKWSVSLWFLLKEKSWLRKFTSYTLSRIFDTYIVIVGITPYLFVTRVDVFALLPKVVQLNDKTGTLSRLCSYLFFLSVEGTSSLPRKMEPAVPAPPKVSAPTPPQRSTSKAASSSSRAVLYQSNTNSSAPGKPLTTGTQSGLH